MRLSAFRLPAVMAPLLSALLLVFAPIPAGAQSTSLGLLDGTVPVTGDDGAWSFSSANGAVTVKPGLGRVPAWNPSQKAERGMLAQAMSVQGLIARSARDLALAVVEGIARRDAGGSA